MRFPLPCAVISWQIGLITERFVKGERVGCGEPESEMGESGGEVGDPCHGMIHALGVKCDIINNPWAQSRLSTLYAYSPFIGYVLSLECVSRNKTMKKHNPYRFYNGLLAAQGFSQSPEAAEVLLREMVRLRLAPTKVTFLAESSRQRDKFRVFVVKVYAADVENLEERLETLVMEHESLEEYNEPKNKTKKKKIDTHRLYNALLSANGYSESSEAAEVLLKGMVGCGFAPTDITFRVMMKALGNSGKSGLAPGYK
ncbi:unnamed protein product [Brassica rapa]|uniref:Pentatricopeptide repeat-containing protein n=1 Tax=Brassica campestris TaxID=3711 RepID=A0A8D9CZ97_BRACM|nr:unnamed protein product [Brassica rapa]